MMNNGGYFVWCLEENTSVSSSWKLFLLKFHWSSHVHPRAFGISRTPHWVWKKSEEFRPLCYFRSRPQGEAMSVSFWLIIYTHLTVSQRTENEKIIVLIVKMIMEFFLSALALINTGFYHIDPDWWQIVGGSEWSIRIQYYDCELF